MSVKFSSNIKRVTFATDTDYFDSAVGSATDAHFNNSIEIYQQEQNISTMQKNSKHTKDIIIQYANTENFMKNIINDLDTTSNLLIVIIACKITDLYRYYDILSEFLDNKIYLFDKTPLNRDNNLFDFFYNMRMDIFKNCANKKSTFLLTTPELFLNMYYTEESTQITEIISTLIIDKLHYINKHPKGMLIEEIILNLIPHSNCEIILNSVPLKNSDKLIERLDTICKQTLNDRRVHIKEISKNDAEIKKINDDYKYFLNTLYRNEYTCAVIYEKSEQNALATANHILNIYLTNNYKPLMINIQTYLPKWLYKYLQYGICIINKKISPIWKIEIDRLLRKGYIYTLVIENNAFIPFIYSNCDIIINAQLPEIFIHELLLNACSNIYTCDKINIENNKLTLEPIYHMRFQTLLWLYSFNINCYKIFAHNRFSKITENNLNKITKILVSNLRNLKCITYGNKLTNLGKAMMTLNFSDYDAMKILLEILKHIKIRGIMKPSEFIAICAMLCDVYLDIDIQRKDQYMTDAMCYFADRIYNETYVQPNVDLAILINTLFRFKKGEDIFTVINKYSFNYFKDEFYMPFNSQMIQNIRNIFGINITNPNKFFKAMTTAVEIAREVYKLKDMIL